MDIELIQNGMELSKVREILNTVIQEINTLQSDEHSNFAYKAWRYAELSIRFQDFDFPIIRGQRKMLTLNSGHLKANIIVGVEGFRKITVEQDKYEQRLNIAYRTVEHREKETTDYQIHLINTDNYDIDRVRIYFNREQKL